MVPVLPSSLQQVLPGPSSVLISRGDTNVSGVNIVVASAAINPVGTITTDQPLFTWPTAAGAVSYDLDVVDLNARHNPVLFVQNISTGATTTTYQTTTAQALTPGQAYTWYFGAVASTGAITWSGPESFNIAALTGSAQISPINNTTLAAGPGYDTPTFSWSSVLDAAQYYLYVVDDLNPHRPIIADSSISGTSFTPSASQALTPGHSYTWYIAAESTNGAASPGAGRRASRSPPWRSRRSWGPAEPLPAATDRPLAGTLSPGANHYYLYMLNNTTDQAIDKPNVSGTSDADTAGLRATTISGMWAR